MEFSESSNGLPSYLEYESITRADTRKFSPNEAFNIRCKLEIIDVIAYLYIFTNITLLRLNHTLGKITKNDCQTT